MRTSIEVTSQDQWWVTAEMLAQHTMVLTPDLMKYNENEKFKIKTRKFSNVQLFVLANRWLTTCMKRIWFGMHNFPIQDAYSIQWYLGFNDIWDILVRFLQFSQLQIGWALWNCRFCLKWHQHQISTFCVRMSTDSLSRLLFAGGGVEIEATSIK